MAGKGTGTQGNKTKIKCGPMLPSGRRLKASGEISSTMQIPLCGKLKNLSQSSLLACVRRFMLYFLSLLFKFSGAAKSNLFGIFPSHGIFFSISHRAGVEEGLCTCHLIFFTPEHLKWIEAERYGNIPFPGELRSRVTRECSHTHSRSSAPCLTMTL
ncbi:hypothetical protein CDAR_36391 [Caerostris darwini]|uniref:Uncharacterized protein n=1 Tax=Caerostris darwini TaxID=1538125 RepID=A0AAV4SPY1_9ARAC|nr:hypothetical protein CDAR_36391 [Caerostris darwini]